jgi:hypothetical protein
MYLGCVRMRVLVVAVAVGAAAVEALSLALHGEQGALSARRLAAAARAPAVARPAGALLQHPPHHAVVLGRQRLNLQHDHAGGRQLAPALRGQGARQRRDELGSCRPMLHV